MTLLASILSCVWHVVGGHGFKESTIILSVCSISGLSTKHDFLLQILFLLLLSSFSGKGGLILWPLFGATNQLLAGLSFLVITFYLWRRGRAVWFLVIPMIFMLIMPIWAMTYQLFIAPGWLNGEAPNLLLGGIGLATIALEIWMIVEAIKLFPKAKGLLEENALDQKPAKAAH